MSKMLPFFNGRILTFIQNIQIMITWIPVVNFFGNRNNLILQMAHQKCYLHNPNY